MGFHIIIRTYLLFDKYEKPYSFGKFGFLKEAWGFSQESIINFFFEPKKLFFFPFGRKLVLSSKLSRVFLSLGN